MKVAYDLDFSDFVTPRGGLSGTRTPPRRIRHVEDFAIIIENTARDLNSSI